jgi:hypothetical protein
MALVDTGKAISKVTELLVKHLGDTVPDKIEFPPTVLGTLRVETGRTEPPKENNSAYNSRLNLFLYEASFDASLKNVPLVEGQPEPLWLVLRYLLTAYDHEGNSDTAKAHEILGEGIRALQQLNFLWPPSGYKKELGDNPEPLKITFNHATAELLSKLMQGGDEKYRFSMAFEVRPVMIAADTPPAASLVVGIDHTQTPPEVLEEKEKGVHIDVIPSMGPVVDDVFPFSFELEETVTMQGSSLGQAGLSVRLGSVQLGASAQQPDKLQFKVDSNTAASNLISAGSYPLRVVKTLAYGRVRASDIRAVNLLPTLDNAKEETLTLKLETVTGLSGQVITGDVKLEGKLLGTTKDDIIVLFHRNGKVVAFIDGVVPKDASGDQTGWKLEIKKKHKIRPGTYRLFLVVNGQRARKSPQVKLEV